MQSVARSANTNSCVSAYLLCLLVLEAVQSCDCQACLLMLLGQKFVPKDSSKISEDVSMRGTQRKRCTVHFVWR